MTAAPFAGSAAAPPIWADLSAGPHQPGFRRAGGGVSVWYPSTGGTAMTLGDYYAPASRAEYRSFLLGAGLSAATVDAMFGAAMAARLDAAELAGPFPVVVIGQGNGQHAADQAVLAEYLASHGYIVATTTSPMAETPMTSEDQVGPFAERQARDLQRALDVLGASPAADVTRATAIGHSFGARAALLLAMRDNRVRAVVSLDGGIGTSTASASFMKAESFDASKAVAPILHWFERLDAVMTPDFTLLDGLPAAVTKNEVSGLHHIHFTTLGFVSVMIPDFGAATGLGTGARASLTRIAEGTLAFIRQQPGAPR